MLENSTAWAWDIISEFFKGSESQHDGVIYTPEYSEKGNQAEYAAVQGSMF